MGSNWTLKKIGEFAEVKGGKRLPKGKRLSEKKTTHPYIRVVDFTDGRISLSNLLYVPEEVFPNIKRYIVESGDVVISIVGTIGLVATIPTELHEANLTENAAKILIEDTTVDSQYLSYYLKSSIGQHEIQRNTVGSTQPKLPLYGIKNIEVSYPPLPEQRAIAHILGSLDDKIELNRRMDKTLEAMARSIFKSWFVDFDPVHAKAEGRPTGLPDDIAALFPDSFEESEMGKIPKGWEVKTISSEFNLTMGQSPPGKTYNEIGNGLPFFQGRRDFGFRYPSNRVYCTAPQRLADHGDTLVSVRAPVGDINMAMERCCVGRGVAAVRHKSGSRSYTYYAMNTLSNRFARFDAEGTVFGAINKRQFEELSWLTPGEKLVSEFEKIAFPFDEQIEKNTNENKTLIALRDTLLPKLISGELRVPDAEKFIEEAGV